MAIESHAAAPEARFRDAVGGDPGMLAAAESLLPQYRVARVVGGLLELGGNLATARPELRFTLAPRSVTDAENLLERPIPWLPGPTEDPRAAYDGNEWAWGVAAAERIVRLMVRDLRSRFDSATDAGPNLKVISECLNRIEAVRDAILAELSARAEGARRPPIRN